MTRVNHRENVAGAMTKAIDAQALGDERRKHVMPQKSEEGKHELGLRV